jgi:hypothetical protein
MIWRLLASVLAVSDTGGVSVTSESSNWPTEQQCVEMIRTNYVTPPPQEINGHRIAMRVSATCVPVDFNVNSASVANGGPMPPVDCRYQIGGRIPQPGCLPPGITNPYVR